MILVVLAILGLAAFLALMASLNGGHPTRHVNVPPGISPSGTAEGDDAYR